MTATVLIVVNDWLASFQIAAESWYVASPDLTVAKTRRLERDGHALDAFLDKVSDYSPATGTRCVAWQRQCREAVPVSRLVSFL